MRKKARKPVNYVASTIYVTPSQHDYLRRRAYEEKRTAAEIIRELVAREMESHPVRVRGLELRDQVNLD